MKLGAQRIVLVWSLTTLVGIQGGAGQLRTIHVQDCVRTRRVVDQEVQIYPDGSRVVYVVKAPDIVSNRNDYRLYVRDLAQDQKRGNGRLLVHADLISGLRWISPAKIIAKVGIKRLKGDDLDNHLSIVDANDGHLDRLSLPFDFQLYSSSEDGETIAFSVRSQAGGPDEFEPTRDEQARGFRVVFGSGSGDSYEHLPTFDLYVGRRTRTGKFSIRKLCVREAASSSSCSPLRNVLGLSLSPDAKRLLVTYSARESPVSWKDEVFLKNAKGVGTLFETYVLGLYDIGTGKMSLGFNYLGTLVHVQWLPDSKHYVVLGPSPFGTEDASSETGAAIASGQPLYYMNRFQHVFVVDAKTGTATSVLRREGGEPGNFKLWSDFPLWTSSHALLLRVSDRTFSSIETTDEEWEPGDLVDLPAALGAVSSLTSKGKKLVGVSQTTMRPPDLFVFDLKRREASLLTDLNPEYSEIKLGQVERLEWANRYGSRCTGLLIKPVDFEAGKRYPMVFLAANTMDDFISDAPYATTAYAPQPLADAGFVVVLAHYPTENKVPPGEFPGDMSFAYNWMSMAESVIDLLAARKMVDPERVGIGGFSRTSWLIDFALTHSMKQFVAASSADSGIYNYGTYFRSNSREDMESDETQLGGPPYAATLTNWIKYAPPFNAEKVSAAVLMEYIGVAEHGFEFFTALARQGKRVEFYRYPKGKHPLDTPFERQASLQRNIDWFCFWLQGYERPNPEDRGQYVRWRALRAKRDAADGN